jgi:LPS-assembly protein
MKNKITIIVFILVFGLNLNNMVKAEDFIFEVTDLEILDNGNIYKGNNRGKIKTTNQLELESDNFEYLKIINRLESNGDAIFKDFKNNVTINAEKIVYLKNQEKIYTEGKTKINVKNKYTIVGFNMTLLKNELIIYSQNKATIYDNASNIYKLDEYEYDINKEILKGKKIEVITNSNTIKSDKFFFSSGFFNFKADKFLGKDSIIKLHKSIFDNNKNDPRIKSSISSGDEFNTYFDKAVFTSCEKTDKCPPWKISSKKIHHNKIKKQIIYKNSWLELYDFPVFYFPYFFHPDPSVTRQTGLLKPEFGSHNTLGDSLYLPYFYVISKNKDMTIKPRLFKDKSTLQTEYRQISKNLISISDFSFTKNNSSKLTNNSGLRTHFFSNTEVNLDLENFTKSNLNIKYQSTSNDNYLKLYDFIKSPLLKTNIDSLESIIKLDLDNDGYNFTTSFEMYETLSGSNSDRYQYVLPQYTLSKNFYPENLNGAFFFDSNGSNTLYNTNTSSTTISNNLVFESYDFFFDSGIKTNFIVSAKNQNSIGKNHDNFKNSPQSELMSFYTYNLSMPLQKTNKNFLNTIVPKLSFRFNPHDTKDNSTASRRIDVNNVFNGGRTGANEGGESVTLGLDFKQLKINKQNEISEIEDYFDFKLATVFRLNEEKNIPTSSTLNKKTSNIFGKLSYIPNEIISLNYDFSVKNDLNTFEYNFLTAKFNYNKFQTEFNYLEERGVIGQSSVIENITKYKVNEENSIIFKTRENKHLNLTEYYNLIYEYKNDCLVAGLRYNKKYYQDAEIKPLEELFFSITIVPLTTFSPDKMVLNK